ncbi:hypothetical protein R0145_10815 [Raineyella sp. W15-4]|nr:hypothetical protein [Raineyella sp. W15-4]WOQ15720.1 hypothetical protein R0145_10815 [Raineyella sp. W15-4]
MITGGGDPQHETGPEPFERRTGHRGDLCLGDEHGDAAAGHHQDHRGDEGLDLEPDHQEPAEGTDHERHHQAQQHRHGDGPDAVRARRPSEEGERERQGYRHHRADRQVDAAGGDDQSHPQTQQGRGRGRPQDVDELPEEVPVGERDGEEAGAHHVAQHKEDDERHDGPEHVVRRGPDQDVLSVHHLA